MDIALEEAKQSLKEGNCGFGAVIVKNKQIIARAHDTEKTDNDPTAHAEINAIKIAASRIGKNLADCLLIATHEPCPMCSTAAAWSKIDQLGYGYSIKEAIMQGRKRIDLGCKEIFKRAGLKVTIHEGIKNKECSVLYDKKVRQNIKQLQNSNPGKLKHLAQELTKKRIDWFSKHSKQETDNCLDKAYELFLKKLGITSKEAPIVYKNEEKIVIHSMNFCPTLEACKILDLDTRVVCKEFSEIPTDVLLKLLNPHLSFSRNYKKIRPYSPYCEEMITFDKAR